MMSAAAVTPLATDLECLSAGQYLGYRLLSLRCTTVFTVPGDFNLPLLDALALVPGLKVVNCSSELACAYAADGYARARPGSVGVCITTFLVGALSSINGAAGSYAEELPTLHIVGVPATWQFNGVCSLHHTLGNAENMSQEVDCFRPVTCYQTILRSFHDARYLIDKALTKCLTHKKPVLLEVCRDMAMEPHSSFGCAPPHMTPFSVTRAVSDPDCLEAAVAAAQRFFSNKQMPLIVLGRRARHCQDAIIKLADVLGWGVAVLHDAKGMFPEGHPSFLGTYSPFYTSPVSVKQCYEAADAILFIGTHFDEMSTGAPPDKALELRSVLTYKSRVLVAHTEAFSGVTTEDFLRELTTCLKPNNSIIQLFRSLPALEPALTHDPQFSAPPEVPLKLSFVMQQIQQQLLAGDEPMAVLVDTGDSMFRTQTLKLPSGTPYEIQMFAANIGWAAPAGLGFSLGTDRRLLVMGGDGGLQMTSGAIGDYVKCGSNAIWVCVNNNGYLIERYLSPIPDATYNYVQNWDYALLAQAMCNKGGKYKVFKVSNESEAVAAFAQAKQLSDHFIFIEVVVDKRDAAPASAALRQVFMTKHFSTITGYKHLNLAGNSLAASTLTAGHDGCVSQGGVVLSGPGRVPSPTLTEGDIVPGQDASMHGGAGVGGGAGEGMVTSWAQGLKGLQHTAGSSTCLVQAGEAHLAESAGAQGAAAAAGAARGGTASRLGLLPAKRHAESSADESN